MIKRIPYYLTAIALLSLVETSRANVYVATNEITSVTNAAVSLSFDKQAAARYKIYARLGTLALPLNLTGNYQVTWDWRDTRVDVLVASYGGYIANGANGEVVVTGALHNIDTGTYDAQVWAVLNGAKVHRLAWNTVIVTNSGASGGSGSVSVDVNFPSPNFTSTGDTIQITGTGSTINIEAADVGGSSDLIIYSNGVSIGTATNGINVDATINVTMIDGRANIGSVQGGSDLGNVLLYTNGGVVGFLNADGYFEPLRGYGIGTVIPTAIHRYSGDTILSNRNIGSVVPKQTNGYIAVPVLSEVAGVRYSDFLTVATGQWVGAAMHVRQSPIVPAHGSGGQVLFGLTWATANHTNYMWGERRNAGNPAQVILTQYGTTFSYISFPAGVAPFNPDASTIAVTTYTDPSDTWWAVDSDSTGTIRGYVGATLDSLHLVGVWTNHHAHQQIVGFGPAAASLSPGTATSRQYIITALLTIEGALWSDPR